MKFLKKIINDNSNHSINPSGCIVFLGDSITQGCFRGYADESKTYHSLLKKKLQFLFPNAVVNFINAGIGGDIAKLGVERLDRDVISRNPDLCVVCYGLNDTNCGKLDEYTDSLTEIFKRLQEKDIEIIFMTPNMMNTYVSDITEEKWLDFAPKAAAMQNDGIYDKFIKAAITVAKRCNVPVCDCYGKWKKLYEIGVDTTALLSNGINHPKEEMHELFANSLLEILLS